MRLYPLIMACLLLFAPWDGCKDSGSVLIDGTGIQGRVYSIATPGPTPIDWVPSPLEKISSVLVLDSNHKFIFEVFTDNKGRFTVELQPGTYYLRVKESMIPAETGPYVVRAGELLSVRAHHDNGMR